MDNLSLDTEEDTRQKGRGTGQTTGWTSQIRAMTMEKEEGGKEGKREEERW